MLSIFSEVYIFTYMSYHPFSLIYIVVPLLKSRALSDVHHQNVYDQRAGVEPSCSCSITKI